MTPKAKKLNVPNQQQYRYLKARLDDAMRAHRSALYDEIHQRIKDPPNIKAARELVDRYDRAKSKSRDDQKRRTLNMIENDEAAVRRVLLFGTPPDALKAVEAFAAKVYR